MKLFSFNLSLEFENCLLPQSFFGRLPVLIPSLPRLEIKEDYDLNLDFLKQFKKLRDVSIKIPSN